MAAGAFLILGITVGVNFSFVLAAIIENAGSLNGTDTIATAAFCNSTGATYY